MIPEWLKGAVAELSNSTAVSGNTVAMMAIAYALLDESVIPHVHKDYVDA